jgi:TetR/AcrR family transcriptional regulator, fatty acid metabolism regulator protein
MEGKTGTRRRPTLRRKGGSAVPRPGGGKRPPLREGEFRRQRRAVERAAERLFASRGYRETSMRMVAAKARCSVGQLYNLYANKLELYRAIWEEKLQELTGLAGHALAEEAPVEERIRALLHRVLTFFQENTPFFQIYMAETGVRLLTSHHGFVDRMMRHHAEMVDQMRRLVEEGQRRGEFRNDIDSTLTALTMMGMVRGHTVECSMRGRSVSLLDREDGILDLFFYGVKNRGERS